MSEFTLPEGYVDVSADGSGQVGKKVITEGKGQKTPQSGDTVYVHYVGTLYGGDRDGEKFDSSRDRGAEFNFNLGTGSVIKAWDEGVASMKKGELAELICSPQYAYGESGSPPAIPPNATLKFEVELLRWQGEDVSKDKNGSVIRISNAKEGTGYDKIEVGNTVKVDLVGYILKDDDSEQEFDNRQDVELVIGDAASVDICPGLEEAILSMKVDEESIYEIDSNRAFGSAGKSAWNIPPNTNIHYKVTLKQLDAFKKSWQLQGDEKFTEAEKMKCRGTGYFTKQNYSMAKIFYEQVSKILDKDEYEGGEEDTKKADELLVAGYSNLALCYLKTADYSECVDNCDKALKINPKNEKALFRKAQALSNRGDFDEAIMTYNSVLSINPSNKSAQSGIDACKRNKANIVKKEKDMCKNIFSKMFKESEKKMEDVPTANGEATPAGEGKIEVETQ